MTWKLAQSFYQSHGKFDRTAAFEPCYTLSKGKLGSIGQGSPAVGSITMRLLIHGDSDCAFALEKIE